MSAPGWEYYITYSGVNISRRFISGFFLWNIAGTLNNNYACLYLQNISSLPKIFISICKYSLLRTLLPPASLGHWTLLLFNIPQFLHSCLPIVFTVEIFNPTFSTLKLSFHKCMGHVIIRVYLNIYRYTGYRVSPKKGGKIGDILWNKFIHSNLFLDTLYAYAVDVYVNARKLDRTLLPVLYQTNLGKSTDKLSLLSVSPWKYQTAQVGNSNSIIDLIHWLL